MSQSLFFHSIMIFISPKTHVFYTSQALNKVDQIMSKDCFGENSKSFSNTIPPNKIFVEVNQLIYFHFPNTCNTI